MSYMEKNAIVFVANKALAINGFALYSGSQDRHSESTNSYKMGYKVEINGKPIAAVEEQEFTWKADERHV